MENLLCYLLGFLTLIGMVAGGLLALIITGRIARLFGMKFVGESDSFWEEVGISFLTGVVILMGCVVLFAIGMFTIDLAEWICL